MSAEIREYTRTQTATGILLTEDNLWEAAQLAVQQGHVTSAGVFTEQEDWVTGREVKGLAIQTEGGENRVRIGEVLALNYHTAHKATPVSGEWQEAVSVQIDSETLKADLGRIRDAYRR